MVKGLLPVNIHAIWILGGLGAIFYTLSMYALVGSSILVDAKKGIKATFAKGN
jgi:hypothetical protein